MWKRDVTVKDIVEQMPDAQWESLKKIFHAALALRPQERATYLEQVCSGDIALRHAVESLLKSHEETNNFVDTPAFHAAADMLLDGSAFKANQTVGISELFRCWARAAWDRYI